MLTLYANQLTDLELELAKLTEMLEQKKQMAKALKATERKATKLLDGLKGLIEELPTDARANLRTSIIALFPSPQSPVTDSSGNDSPVTEPEEKLPIIEAIKAAEEAKITFTPTPAGLFPPQEPLTDAGKLEQPEVTSDLPDLGEKTEEQTSQGQPEEPGSDIPIATAPEQLENAFSQIPQSVTDADVGGTPELKTDEQQPEVEVTSDAIATYTPATAINEFCALVKLNETVAYIRKNGGQTDGEIMSAYVGCSTQKLAKDWAECMEVWGATQTEVRKPQRITDAKWEVKIWGLSFFKLTRLAEFHKSFGEAVPQVESTKKQQKRLENIAEKSPEESGETASFINSNSIAEESSEKPENSSLEPQDEAAKDAKIIAAGELAKEELGLAEAPLNDTPMQGDFVRIVSGHYAGLSGKATVTTRKGGIIATNQGNRWVSWSDCEVTQKPLAN